GELCLGSPVTHGAGGRGSAGGYHADPGGKPLSPKAFSFPEEILRGAGRAGVPRHLLCGRGRVSHPGNHQEGTAWGGECVAEPSAAGPGDGGGRTGARHGVPWEGRESP